MTLTFQILKDWSGLNSGQTTTSFKKGEYVIGDVVESNIPDPKNYIVVTNKTTNEKVKTNITSYVCLVDKYQGYWSNFNLYIH